MDREKVYCSDCVYFRHDGDWCTYPANTYMKDTYLGTQKAYRNRPARLNEDNDCSWFVMRWWKRLLAGWSK
jgi:hypothetical protein